MQKKLQQFENTFLKKQTSKLHLEIKLSLINSQYYEQTLSRSPKYSPSPTTKNSLSIKPFDTTERSNLTDTSTDMLDDRIQKLQHEVDKQFLMIQKYKQILKGRLTDYQNAQLCRQKRIKQLSLKRKIQIQTLKRQLKLAIKCNIQQRQYFFHRLQSQFDMNVESYIKTWKKVKKIWKSQLKTIVEKFEGHKDSKSLQTASNTGTQSAQNINGISLKSLQKQLKDHLVQSQKASLKLQLKLSSLIQNFEIKREQLRQKYSNNLVQILQSVAKMQKSIKTQVKKQHLEAEQNRQKLLLLFEQNAQKIDHEKQRQAINEFKPPKLEYRHLI